MGGMRGVNPRQMKQAMKKMGIVNEEIKNVTEVIIRTPTKEYVFTRPAVTMMAVQGSKHFDILGDPIERVPGDTTEIAVPEELPFTDDDIEIVVSQCNCTREDAITALKECDGAPAEAIIKIMSR